MPVSQTLSLAVLISGNGSNLQALIDAIEAGQVQAKISVVLSNRAQAKGLQRAQLHHIPTVIIDHTLYPNRESFDQAMLDALAPYQPELVVLAGFMRILSAPFIQALEGRLINIHPSLLPAYKGTHTHQRVLHDHAPLHGCSVHFVTEELDGGPLIAQTEIAVHADDDVTSLAARVQKEEHQLYPLCIQWLSSGKISLKDHVVLLDQTRPLPRRGLIFRHSDYSRHFLE